ncbi:MAG: hypothetical protein J6W79_02105 [Alphaproteobacteria bacterium]|nr:hypothetical protein [Alphaproteobacteria bacterium]
MHLVSEVIFNYRLTTGNLFSTTGDFSCIQELKKAIGEKASFETPISVRIVRTVKIMDTDSPIRFDRNPLCFSKDKYTTVKFDGEHFDFIVADKLVYPYDVRVLLREKYGTILDLESKKLNNDIPVLYSGVTEHSQYGLKDEQGRPTIQTLRYVNCRNLTDKDIVVDRNLCQIWPTKSKKPLLALEKFLHRTKENVHQK